MSAPSATRWQGKHTFIVLCVACLLATSLAGAEPSKIVGDLSVPRGNWQLFGPLDSKALPLEPALLKKVPTELTIAGKTLKPRPVNVEDKFGRCNLGPMIGGTEIGKTAYVFIPFTAKADMDATLGFGSNGYLQVWLDGTVILDTTANGGKTKQPTIQDHQVTTRLTKGTHVLAVRFVSGSGSSILAVGGPNELQLGPPPYPLPLRANIPMLTGNLIANGGFEDGAAADPFIPAGWMNGEGLRGLQKAEATLNTKAPIFGKRSLEINTLTSGAAKRTLSVPFAADVDTCYQITFNACHLAGEGYVSVSVRDDLSGRFNTSFVRAIGCDNTYDLYRQAIKKDALGACKVYYFFDSPNPSLVIETHGPVRAVLDDICIVPVDRSRVWDTWCEQRSPRHSDWNALSDTVVTPHTAWAKPYAGGTLKVLSLMARKRHRMTVELAQRLSMEYTPVFWEWDKSPSGPSVLGYDYWVYDADGDPQLFMKEADTLAKLARPTDCIVIANLDASAITPRMTEAILKQVSAGAGLVIMGSPYYIKNLPAFAEGPWAVALNEKNRTANELDWVSQTAASVTVKQPDATQAPAFYEFGRGRVALWSEHIEDDRVSLETHLPGMIKAMLWASRKLPAIRIGAIALPGKPNGALSALVQREATPSQVKVTLSSARPLPQGVTVTGWIDDFRGEAPLALGSLTPTETTPTAAFALPPLPPGKHRVHFQVKRNNKVEDWSTALVEVTAPAGIKAIELDRKNRLFTAGEPVTGRVTLNAPLKPDQTLRLQLTDADGRLWAAKKFAPDGTGFAFSLPTDPAVVLRHSLRAAVMDSTGSVAEAKTEFSVVRPPSWYATFFDFQVWNIPDDYLFARALRLLGVTGDFHNSLGGAKHAQNNIRRGPPVGTHWEAENKPGVFFPNHQTTIQGDKEHAPIRYPCLNDPEYQAQMAKKIEMDLGLGTQYGLQGYSLAHEWNYRSYGKLGGPVDTCFCANCLASFHKFVQSEYGTLDHLNAAWGSAFANWEAVTPIVLADALKANQIPRWIDHRRHADQIFADFFKLKLAALRKVDPGAEGGVFNLRVSLTTLDSYSGVDFWRLYHDTGVFSCLQNPYILSFTPRDSSRRHLIGRFDTMWLPTKHSGNEDLYKLRSNNMAWTALLSGTHGVAYSEDYFFMPPSSPMSPQLNADLSVGPCVQSLADATAHIRTGISHLLFEGQRSDSGIALLYSRSSEHAATAWQATLQANKLAAKISPPSQMGFFTDALNALGYQYSAMSEEQVVDGALTKGGYKLLILPVSQALPAKVVEQIRAFVRDGGCVVADIRPGMGDQHWHLGATGALDDVFGVRHQTAYTAYEPVLDEIEDVASLGSLPPQAICGPAVALAGAKAQGKGRRSAIPTFLVNRFGKGQAMLLNCVAPTLDEPNLRMLAGVLAAAGLKPLFHIEQPPRQPTTKSVQITSTADAPLGDAQGIVSGLKERDKPILTDFINGRIHCFGFWRPARRGIGNEELTITPPVAGHIYDLKSNKYLGRQERFAVTLPLESTAFFASVPYAIQKPDLTLAPAEAKNGLSSIRCQARLNPKEAAQENQVIQFRIFAPDGTEWPDFAVTRTARAGTAEHLFVLPMDAPHGNWRVEAREAISGLADTRDVTL